MSDCFDHEAEAWDNYDLTGEIYAEGANLDYVNFVPNPLFYHRKVSYEAILKETDKAYLFKLSEKLGVWVPKSICREVKPHTAWVHKRIYEKCSRVNLS